MCNRTFKYFSSGSRFRNCMKSCLIVTVLFLFLGNACTRVQDEVTDDVLLARVYNSTLYQSDLAGLIPAEIPENDSISLISRYVDNWVKQQVFLHQAMNNMNTEALNLDKKLEDYRNSLIIFSFENELVKQHLDTLVTDQQIADYYEANQNSFMLRDNIVKVLYAKVPLDAPDMRHFRRLYRSEDPDDILLLEDYCIQHAARCYIDTGTWLFFQDLLREVPIQTTNQEVFLRSNKYVELTDDYFRYFLNIVDYKLKGSTSPLVLERQNVRNIMINIRRHSFINEQRNIFLQQAATEGKMEKFTN